MKSRLVALALAALPVFGIASTVDAASKTLTNSQWETVQNNANKYKRDAVDIKGQVMTSPIYSNGVTQYELYLDPTNLNENVIVFAKGKPKFKDQQYVEVRGKIYGMVSGTNALGATLHLPAVVAANVKQVSSEDVLAPTVAISSATSAQQQNGLTIKVTRVEYAANETRVFLVATNQTGANVTFDDMESTLVQGNSQLQEKMFSNDAKDFPFPMANGVTAQAVWVFDSAKIKGGSLTLNLSVSSDNYNQNWNPYTFTIAPPKPAK